MQPIWTTVMIINFEANIKNKSVELLMRCIYSKLKMKEAELENLQKNAFFIFKNYSNIFIIYICPED